MNFVLWNQAQGSNNSVRLVSTTIHRSVIFLFLCLLLPGIGCKEKLPHTKLDVAAISANAPDIPIGHRVRIRSTKTTLTTGLAGRSGTLAGFTRPSHSGAAVIGEAKDDVAFAVQFENPDTQAWFAPELLEFIERTSTLEVEIYGKHWTWSADGSLIRSPG